MSHERGMTFAFPSRRQYGTDLYWSGHMGTDHENNVANHGKTHSAPPRNLLSDFLPLDKNESKIHCKVD